MAKLFDIHGQLPFKTHGMDDPAPMIDFSPSGNPDSSYPLEHEDFDGLLHVLDDLEESLQSSSNDVAVLTAAQELLSASWIMVSQRHAIEADQHVHQEFIDQLQAVEESISHLELEFQEEWQSLQAESERINSQLQEVDFTAADEQKCSAQLHNERASQLSDGLWRTELLSYLLIMSINAQHLHRHSQMQQNSRGW
ncbi:hypothetical protein L208DRAFT_1381756 [Tricholoma matsutake]|nr:hypothetical protein L208DRAFT_1381756 [Tricholoma matsutake 945]